MSVILTGLQATGKMHLGNYFGAIQPMVEKSKSLSLEDKLYMFVPDLHSFTTPIDHTTFYQKIIDNLKIYLASGIDFKAENIFLYRQSRISAHSELTWILSCFSYTGELSKMHQFKDKSRNKGETVSVGLFTYPILMVADILLYEAEFIPLGEDQRQHLELARDISIRMNNKFTPNSDKKLFVEPRNWSDQLAFRGSENSLRIRSLQNPEKKMSKSVIDPNGTILLTDEPKEAANKIMRAVTDTFQEINWNFERQPGITNLLQLLALLSGLPDSQIIKDWTKKTTYGDLKKQVAIRLEDFLTRFQKQLEQTDIKDLETLLEKKELLVEKQAKKVLNRVQKAIGLYPSKI